jgi:hypothetical protein
MCKQFGNKKNWKYKGYFPFYELKLINFLEIHIPHIWHQIRVSSIVLSFWRGGQWVCKVSTFLETCFWRDYIVHGLCHV